MICKKCNLDKNEILFSGKCWNIVFAKQDYLGRCIFVTKRHIDDYINLTDEELIEFRDLLKSYKRMLHEKFACSLLNWCCNMNNSSQDENYHVHLHIRPRYKDSVKVNGEIYTDKEYGSHYDRQASIQFTDNTVKFIKLFLKDNFSKYYNIK